MKPQFWMRYVIIGAVMIAFSVSIIFHMVHIQNLPSAAEILKKNESWQGVLPNHLPRSG